MNMELPLPTADQKEIYRRIRNFLAGRLVGATRDRALLDELIKVLFCRVYFLHHGDNRAEVPGDALQVAKKYRELYRDVKERLPGVFESDSELLLDPEALAFVDGQLSQVDLVNPKRDPLGDAYEAFATDTLRQQEGQFFTPLNAVDWIVEALQPQPGERVIDPACGAGGFLSATARYLARRGTDQTSINSSIFGIEKDRTLARLARSHIAVTTLGEGNILCADALAMVDEDGTTVGAELDGSFDLVMSNPPFGSKIVSASDAVRGSYLLGRKWRKKRGADAFDPTGVLMKNVPPQVLFVERILRLLKPSGRFGIVLPESLVSSGSYGYVVQFLMTVAQVEAVVGMPEALFKSSGKGGTHTKTCLVIGRKCSDADGGRKIFMAEAKWCGHDSRGRTIPHDDLPGILKEFQDFKSGAATAAMSQGYAVATQDLKGTVLAPRYYDPGAERELEILRQTHELIRIGDLVEAGVLELSTGDEPGKLAYGTGNIPFVRTSDISNWEIKFDPKHCVSEEIFKKYATKQDVREGDILFVRDGTYLIGSCAFVSEYDTKIVYQSHLYKIRSNDWDRISPFLLLACLSCEPVQKQIKAKRFTMDIIDSIGSRLLEVVIPLPRDAGQRRDIEDTVKQVIKDRIEARELARKARLAVCAPTVQ